MPPPPDGEPSQMEGQMSASTRTVPAQVGWGRFSSALAALALVVILAVSLAIVALGGTKAAPAAEANPAPAQQYVEPPSRSDFHLGGTSGASGTGGFGGWNGPRAGSSVESSGGHNGTRIAQ
jgi:hypothetical protein